GGSGRDYVDFAIEKFKEKYPDVKIITDIGPKNAETLRPRFVAGNPPDVIMANYSELDYFALIADDQLAPIDEVLASPVPGNESKTLEDLFVPGILDRGESNGKRYILPGFVHYYGFWYDKALFDENGWSAPNNYDELMSVSQQIQEAGEVSPFTYQGLYPSYLLRTMFFPLVASHGGTQAIDDIDNLVPGAWQSEAVINAARDIQEFTAKYLMDGTIALNHTQAQMEFINRRAAMIPCGTYLENEMKGNWPDDFELKYMFTPVRDDNGGSKYTWATCDFVSIPSKAKNPEMAKEFLKILYTDDVRAIGAEKAGGVNPIVGGADGFEELLPASVVYTNDMLSSDDAVVIFGKYEIWYKTIYKKAQDSLTALVTGKYTPEEFAEEVEKEAERVRNDDSIKKY
ncbi:MAG TPA: extracellular solute-binding protein, partial [Thermoanaerobacterales bacterium]|nr:extracellular solute-binding protein [Thermoanaerobacterales bacterium]